MSKIPLSRLPLGALALALSAGAVVGVLGMLRGRRRSAPPAPLPPDTTEPRPSSGSFMTSEYDETGTASGDPLAGVLAAPNGHEPPA